MRLLTLTLAAASANARTVQGQLEPGSVHQEGCSFDAETWKKPGTCEKLPPWDGTKMDIKRPTFFMHGIMSFAADGTGLSNAIGTVGGKPAVVQSGKDHVKGANWVNVAIYEGAPTFEDKKLKALNSVTPMRTQLAALKKVIEDQVAGDPEIWKDGYNLVCHSQGGVNCRALIETWDDHNVKAFISMAGPQMGVMGIYSVADALSECLTDFGAQKITEFVGDKVLYTNTAQKHISFANYWNCATNEKDFQKYSSVMAPILNMAPWDGCPSGFAKEESAKDEVTMSFVRKIIRKAKRKLGKEVDCTEIEGDESDYNKNPQFVENLKKLEVMAVFGSPADGTIVPYQSTLFGYYAPGSGPKTKDPKMLNWDETDVATKGLLPLVEMHKAGKFVVTEVPDVMHFCWSDASAGGKDAQLMKDHYLKYL